jgi:hypothetical protein
MVTFTPLTEGQLKEIASTASHESLTEAFSKLELPDPEERPLSAIDVSVFEFANPNSRAKIQRRWNEKNRPGWYEKKKKRLEKERKGQEDYEPVDL